MRGYSTGITAGATSGGNNKGAKTNQQHTVSTYAVDTRSIDGAFCYRARPLRNNPLLLTASPLCGRSPAALSNRVYILEAPVEAVRRIRKPEWLAQQQLLGPYFNMEIIFNEEYQAEEYLRDDFRPICGMVNGVELRAGH